MLAQHTGIGEFSVILVTLSCTSHLMPLHVTFLNYDKLDRSIWPMVLSFCRHIISQCVCCSKVTLTLCSIHPITWRRNKNLKEECHTIILFFLFSLYPFYMIFLVHFVWMYFTAVPIWREANIDTPLKVLLPHICISNCHLNLIRTEHIWKVFSF